MSFKADLRNTPYFFSPRDSKRVPSLARMLRYWSEGKIDIISLNACHTTTSGIDYRWEDYMEQARILGDEFDFEYYEKKGFADFYSPKSRKRMILLRTQQVRARNKGMPVDVNIIGAPQIIEPARPVAYTLKEGRNCGALRFACHVGSNCGLDVRTASEFYHQKLIDGVEV